MNYTHFHGTINLLLLRPDYHDCAGNHPICLVTPQETVYLLSAHRLRNKILGDLYLRMLDKGFS
jgi:hypothetical protein